MISRARVLAIWAAVGFAACASETLHNVGMSRASSAAVQGRWDDAHAYMSELVASEEANPRSPPTRLAEDYGHLGAWAGMSCRFDEAERDMERSHEYYVRANDGNQYIASLELAELEFGRNRYAAAVARFKQGLTERDDREPMNENHAMELDDYAVALDETGDHAEAVAVRERVYAWRKEHPGARWTGPMAYGRNCPESSVND